MRIALLYSNPRIGGAEAFGLAVAKCWRDRHEMAIVNVCPQGGELRGFAKEQGVPFVGIESGLNLLAPRTLRALRAVVTAARFDIVLVFGLRLQLAMRLFGCGWLPEATWITMLRGLDPWRRLHHILADRWTQHRFSCHVACSRAVCESWLRRERYSARRLVVIPNGIDVSHFAPGAVPPLARSQLGIPHDATVCVTLANLRPIKGYDFLTESLVRHAERFRNLALWFLWVGAHHRSWEPLRRRLAAVGLAGRVLAPGAVRDVRPYLATADLCVLPSQSEGMPRAVMEAMAMGVPVVATDVGGTGEVVRHNRDGVLVGYGEPDAMAEAVVSLACDPARRRRLGDSARQRIASTFDIQRVSEEYLTLFECLRDESIPTLEARIHEFRKRSRYHAAPEVEEMPSPGKRNGSPRVFYLVTSAFSERLVEGQLEYLRARGYEMVIGSAPCGERRGPLARQGIARVALPMKREIALLSDLVALRRIVRKMKEIGPSVVNASTPKAALLGMLGAWLARVPVRVYMQRGLRLETTRGLKRAVLWASERLASACATRVICVSESLRERYVELGLAPAAKTVVLGAGSSNGVDAERFRRNDDARKQAAAIRGKLAIPAEAPVVGFVGRLTRDKGIVELLEAFERVRQRMSDVRLLLVGDFEEGDPVPRKFVDRLKAHPQAAISGFVEDTAPYYHAMDVLAFPSHREGFPNAPLEAAAAELPVAGFRATGTVDAVLDGVTGTLVPLGDVDALSAALLRYLQSPELRRQHGRAGRERVLLEFRQERVWNALFEEYRRLLEAAGIAAGQRVGDDAFHISTGKAVSTSGGIATP